MIISRDIRFIKDDLPNNLTIVDIYKTFVTLTNIDKFVNKIIALQAQLPAPPIWSSVTPILNNNSIYVTLSSTTIDSIVDVVNKLIFNPNKILPAIEHVVKHSS